ncbi:hypothetical protein [Cupriavidus pampae]|uniref:Uncharacterized protein n=1 Tax=Cupriavidus pampae TaxID=659251 RepID=A0ABN7ZGZ2_9BURK|nr:hypothetical protein [Cupriavidus pampae]CAG9184463.1 hypothetical protein LMG32289_05625 [Cupriavidus pampae]
MVAPIEVLESFGLPDTFTPEMVPLAGQRFVQACAKGMTKDALMRAARRAGFDPLWKRLENMGAGVYGFGLTIDGMVVPFMVRMRATAPAREAPAPMQAVLF